MKELSVLGYYADINGNVFSMKNRKNKSGNPYLLKLWVDDLGYKHVVLRVSGKGKRFSVHRLVCEAYNGLPSADKNICMHLNGDTSDNRPDNLKWGTQKENKSHEVIHGTKLVGSALSWAKYSDEQIIEVKKLLVEGFGYKFIAEKTGVEYQSVCQCASGKQWAHIPFQGSYHYSKKSGIKLTETDVVHIKKLLEQGLKSIEIANLFGVNRITVHDIKAGRSWLNIN
jgi:HNH endonuclease